MFIKKTIFIFHKTMVRTSYTERVNRLDIIFKYLVSIHNVQK